ncbi:peptidylprolyl isomerase [Sphingomonas sp. SUN019]|uniref:peptidylprolyl isomerase n=1 Tax=Sphingomonas sp. SUN019 TaxID=2937788 RepID=UPI0021649523|nr:peptidylprolyl isomerase [Sphingomonas sp. SUN019]UVO52030.1 peptidylprolyl isomerase [Sphingomonas sp. SUN019]
MRMFALALLALSSPTVAQVAPTPVAAPTPAPVPVGLVRVTLTTAEGSIVIALDKQKAPVTVANFLRYVDGKRLDGAVFYRAVKVQENYGFIQFGAQNDPKRVLPSIAHEPTTKTGLSHTDGAISMAMGKPGTANGDFVILVGDIKSMDATATDPGYAVFGHVVEGMDIVRRILPMPRSVTKGVGMMKGQMLEPTVKIMTVRRTPVTTPAK